MAGTMPVAALASADPRLGDEADIIGTSKETKETSRSDSESSPPRLGSVAYTDSSVTFEEYHYWANKTREYEKTLSTKDAGLQSLVWTLLGKKEPEVAGDGVPASTLNDDKASDSGPSSGTSPEGPRYGVTDEEYYHAQRAVRTATWGSVFYLITTDILGPYSVPWAISQMGYGPGTVLYVVFGILAFYSGTQLWQIFLGLDSTRYPIRNYGDVAFRIFGNPARILCNVLQSFQFFLGVVLLVVTNAQGLAQMAAGVNGTGHLCFVVAEVVFMLCGFVLGQIRTLARLGWLANLAVWLNVVVIIMTMVVCSQYGPNYAASESTFGTAPNQPIVTSGYWPPGLDLSDHVNGLMQAVYSFGGASLFNELMAEMRRPWDFWKALICAEIFIFSVYITMGLVVYSYQGQYSYNPAYQGIPNSAYSWQTLGNAVFFISGLIAALLYGNIGAKVFYAAVLRDIFHLPALNDRTGKWIWVALVPIYWSLAFILAAAIPQVSYLGSFVGAACILQFSYTFPPILLVAYHTHKDAMLAEEHFDPATRSLQRVDHGWTRWVRGYKKKIVLNTVNVVYFLGALTTAILGIYSSVIGMHASFTSPSSSIESFSCKNPAG